MDAHEDKKKAYADKFEAQLKTLTADLDKLKAKAQGVSADLRVKLNTQLEELGHKQQAAKQKFEEYKLAGQDKIDGIKMGLEKSWGELKASFDEASKTDPRA